PRPLRTSVGGRARGGRGLHAGARTRHGAPAHHGRGGRVSGRRSRLLHAGALGHHLALESRGSPGLGGISDRGGVSLFGARSAAAAGAAALLSIAGESLACPCGNSATVNGPLTSQMETSGFMAAQSLTLVHGAFNARGEDRSLDDNHQGPLLWAGSAAYRLERRVELGATLSYGRSWLRHGALSASDEGFGDLQLRAFWDAIDEPMPYYKSFWPALGIFATVRIPTRGLTGPVGGGGS